MRQIAADLRSTAEEITRSIVGGNRGGALGPLGIQVIVIIRGGRSITTDDCGRTIAKADQAACVTDDVPPGRMNGSRVVAIFQHDIRVCPANNTAVAVCTFFIGAGDLAVVGAGNDLVVRIVDIAHNAAHANGGTANGKRHIGAAVFDPVPSANRSRNAAIAEVRVSAVLLGRDLSLHTDIFDGCPFQRIKKAHIAMRPIGIDGDVQRHGISVTIKSAAVRLILKAADGSPVIPRQVDAAQKLAADGGVPLVNQCAKGHQVFGISDLVRAVLGSLALERAARGKDRRRERAENQHKRKKQRNSSFHDNSPHILCYITRGRRPADK